MEQVNLSTTDGDLGILANHVPAILQLKPGLVEIFTQTPSEKKHFFGKLAVYFYFDKFSFNNTLNS